MEKIMEDLRQAIIDGDEIGQDLVEDAIRKGIDPLRIIETCVAPTLKEIGNKFQRGEIFLLELMSAATIVVKAMDILKPALEKSKEKPEYVGTMIIGTVEGDIHDIGKKIVGSIFIASGFDVIDLGVDVPKSKFVEKVKEAKPQLVGASALLTTTLPKQKDLIDELEKQGLSGSVKVLVGGAPCTPEWSREIGADGYAPDGVEAVKLARSLIGK